MITKEYFLKVANEVCYGFKVDLDNRDLFNLIYFYATQSKKFTDFGHEIEKGFFLYSPISGNGKTMAMAILQRLLLNSKNPLMFKKIDMRFLAKEYMEQEKNPLSVLDRFRDGNWLIDDLGCEEERFKYYADNINLGAIVVNFVYPRFHHGQIFHFTSNVSKITIHELYDNRTVTRLLEMTNRIEFNGRSLRNEAKVRPKENKAVEIIYEPVTLTEEQKEVVKQQIIEMKELFTNKEREKVSREVVDYKGNWLGQIKQYSKDLSEKERFEIISNLSIQLEVNGRAIDKDSINEAIKILQNV